ncbi:phosphotransferase [Paucisalibacillus globulus]|uniref:phosphotransferase n=1 Tax=Paucisalibacillus globulus TaxID=351095 RepID=UPI0004047CD7|nr:phosphotransferase [Paucisalibacillus globulus]
MSYNLSRDDQRFNRLSSFLRWEGNLRVKKIHPIKRNIYYIEAESGDKYVLKGHSNTSNMRQQWDFFERIRSKRVVPFVRYPNGKKEISNGTHFSWTIAPYVSGRKLNYEADVDRRRAVNLLKKFHADASQIYIKNLLRKQQFYKRWHARLYKFSETEQIFERKGYKALYNDITVLMKKYLEVVENYPWYRDQLSAERNGLWVHGDVASHNFIQNENTYMIDFDLLHCSPQNYDYIQLGQRFLPHIKWDVERLLGYHMVEENELEKYLYSIFIPSDLIREWIHYLTRKRRISVGDYMETMEIEWIRRKDFLNASKLILNN